MQPRDTVDFVEILPAQQIFTFASVFSLRPDRGYLWLQRICFRILRAIGAFHQTESVTYQRTVVSRRATMDAILRMKDVLAQLGNRVQHALRAFTPRDQKAVKAAASTMRANPGLDIESAITELAVGEAQASDVGLVHEDDQAATVDASIPVVEPVDRGVVLVVGPKRLEEEHRALGVDQLDGAGGQHVGDGEVRRARRRRDRSVVTGRVGELEPGR